MDEDSTDERNDDDVEMLGSSIVLARGKGIKTEVTNTFSQVGEDRSLKILQGADKMDEDEDDDDNAGDDVEMVFPVAQEALTALKGHWQHVGQRLLKKEETGEPSASSWETAPTHQRAISPAQPPQQSVASSSASNLRYGNTGPRATGWMKNIWEPMKIVSKDARHVGIRLAPLNEEKAKETTSNLFTEHVNISQQFLPQEPPAHSSVARALGVTALTKSASAILKDFSCQPLQGNATIPPASHDPVIIISESDCEGLFRTVGKALKNRMSKEQAYMAMVGFHYLRKMDAGASTTSEASKTSKAWYALASAALLEQQPAPPPLLISGASPQLLHTMLCGKPRTE